MFPSGFSRLMFQCGIYLAKRFVCHCFVVETAIFKLMLCDILNSLLNIYIFVFAYETITHKFRRNVIEVHLNLSSK